MACFVALIAYCLLGHLARKHDRNFIPSAVA